MYITELQMKVNDFKNFKIQLLFKTKLLKFYIK